MSYILDLFFNEIRSLQFFSQLQNISIWLEDKKARISMERVYRGHKHVAQEPRDLESNFPEKLKNGLNYIDSERILM